MKLYIKLDAPDICCDLNVVSYHPDVQPVVEPVPGSGQKKLKKKRGRKAKIRLVQTVCLPADSSAMVQVKVKQSTDADLMLELYKSWNDTLIE